MIILGFRRIIHAAIIRILRPLPTPPIGVGRVFTGRLPYGHSPFWKLRIGPGGYRDLVLEELDNFILDGWKSRRLFESNITKIVFIECDSIFNQLYV